MKYLFNYNSIFESALFMGIALLDRLIGYLLSETLYKHAERCIALSLRSGLVGT